MTGAGLRYPVSERLAREYAPGVIREALRVQAGALRRPQDLAGHQPEVVDLASQMQPACLREALVVAESRMT